MIIKPVLLDMVNPSVEQVEIRKISNNPNQISITISYSNNCKHSKTVHICDIMRLVRYGNIDR